MRQAFKVVVFLVILALIALITSHSTPPPMAPTPILSARWTSVLAKKLLIPKPIKHRMMMPIIMIPVCNL